MLGLNFPGSIHQKQIFHPTLPFPLGIRNGKFNFWNFLGCFQKYQLEEPVQDGAQLLVTRKTYICANFWLCCPFQDLIQDEDQRVLPGHRVPETLRDPR